MARRARPHLSTVTYALDPDAAGRQAIAETVHAYEAMLALLDEITAGASVGGNLVLLHELAYETVRVRTGLPAQMVILGFRDFTARRAGATPRGLPLDDKLYAVKGPALLTLSTVKGRIFMPYSVLGYREGWPEITPARLFVGDDGVTIAVGIDHRPASMEEGPMMHEGILARMGRVISGIAHSAVDKAEGLDRAAVVEQAIREIDGAAAEARGELGKAQAEAFRIESRRNECLAELGKLEDQLQTALAQDREDLAKVAIDRQLDLEAQVTALDRALGDSREQMSEARKALQAVTAARKEAEDRLRDLRRSEAQRTGEGAAAVAGRETPADKAARATAAVARLTGVPPGGPVSDAGRLEELERLHRDHLIAERLAAAKSRR